MNFGRSVHFCFNIDIKAAIAPKNWQNQFLDPLGHMIAKKMGLKVGSHWFQCAPNIFDKSLQVSRVCPPMKKISNKKNEALLGQNRFFCAQGPAGLLKG